MQFQFLPLYVKHLLLWAIFFAPCILAYSQTDSVKPFINFSRKSYVQPYVGLYKRTITFVTKEKNAQMYNLLFSPNSAAFAGVVFSYKGINLYAEATIPNTSKVNSKDTKVKSYALFVHHFTKSWGITGFVSYNKGFLMNIPTGAMVMYNDRNDMRMFTVGTHLYKIFNSKNFSYSAVNTLQQQQIKSSGSFMLMTTPLFRRLSSNESIVPVSIRQFHLTGSVNPSKSLRFISLQIRPGYIYNFVASKGKYFFAPAFYAGAGTEYHSFYTSEEGHRGFNFVTSYRLKVVTGINASRYYLTLEYLADRSTTYLYKTNIKNNYLEISFNIGYRF